LSQEIEAAERAAVKKIKPHRQMAVGFFLLCFVCVLSKSGQARRNLQNAGVKNKKSTLLQAWHSDLALAGCPTAIAEDHVVQINAYELFGHMCYHFLSSIFTILSIPRFRQECKHDFDKLCRFLLVCFVQFA
ncbi:MAG: hypothetical protein RRZ93_08330, partial [Ruthenibacterium sp.]